MQVVVDNNSYGTDKLFDYKVPAHLCNKIALGMRVIVPFGRGNRRLEAYVLNDIDKPSNENIKLKDVLAIIDEKPILSENQLRLIIWMKNQYLCKYIEAIHCLIPKGMIKKERKLIILSDIEWRKLVLAGQRKLRDVLTVLEEMGGEIYLDLLIQHVDYKDINDAIKTLLE
ncbi:MAG: primosomal protein N', partial [Alkaliphilus sp.]|nr:primosomal protein N' [Alkaliphilus sp.]